MNKLYITTAAILCLLACRAGVCADSITDYYTLIRPAQPTHVEKGKVEVVEIFYYGCIHCYHYEPHLLKWLKQKPKNVAFSRMPVIFNPSQVPLAKAYYTAQKLGVLDKIHEQLFSAIHSDRRNIFDDDAIKAFFIEQGVNGDEFSRAYNSMAVKIKVKQAEAMVKRYHLTGVPSVVINGKYLTGPSYAQSYDRLVTVMNTLIAKESKGS